MPRRADHTGPSLALLDEAPLEVKVLLIPASSLDPSARTDPLLDRLRTLHRRLLVAQDWHHVDTAWYSLGGEVAVLDRLAKGPGHRVAGFCLAAILADEVGLLALASTSPGREQALTDVALPMASTARPWNGGLLWAVPPDWERVEALEVTTDTARIDVRLESLRPGDDVSDLDDRIFARGPFARDFHLLDDREVEVAGIAQAHQQVFTWQPAGRGPAVTTLVSGLSLGDGFSLVHEAPIGTAGPAVVEAVLGAIAVERRAGPRWWHRWPDADVTRPQPSSQVVMPERVSRLVRPSPTPSQRVARGGTDRVLVAAVDILADRGTADLNREPIGPRLPDDLDVELEAVRASWADVMRFAGPELEPELLERVARWADGALSELGSERRLAAPDGLVGRLVAAAADVHDGAERRSAEMLAASTVPPPSVPLPGAPPRPPQDPAPIRRPPAHPIAAGWRPLLDDGTATMLDAVWAASWLAAEVAARERARPGGSARGLDRVRAWLIDDPDGAWDDALPGVRVDRPLRYLLLRSGHDRLLRSGNEASRRRFAATVQPTDLAVPSWLLAQVAVSHAEQGVAVLRESLGTAYSVELGEPGGGSPFAP